MLQPLNFAQIQTLKRYSVYTKHYPRSLFVNTGEAIQNASGLGLYFVNGKPKWDLTCNVRLSQVHVSILFDTKLSFIISTKFNMLHLY